MMRLRIWHNILTIKIQKKHFLMVGKNTHKKESIEEEWKIVHKNIINKEL